MVAHNDSRPSATRRPRRSRRSLAASLALAAAALGLGAVVSACGGGSDGNGKVAVEGAAAQRGQELAWAKGCSGCHSEDGSYSSGPTWKGIIGTDVRIKGGGTVRVDDEYLRRSILDPNAQVVDKYWPVMPQVPLSATELDDLIAYLHALSPDAPTEAPTTTTAPALTAAPAPAPATTAPAAGG